jgi:hypothetical protein
MRTLYMKWFTYEYTHYIFGCIYLVQSLSVLRCSELYVIIYRQSKEGIYTYTSKLQSNANESVCMSTWEVRVDISVLPPHCETLPHTRVLRHLPHLDVDLTNYYIQKIAQFRIKAILMKILPGLNSKQHLIRSLASAAPVGNVSGMLLYWLIIIYTK